MDVARSVDAKPPGRTLRLTLEYEGTRYAGWQRQAGPITVQQVVEEALGELTGERISVVAAGRTDAGVHALGQVVSFRSSSRIPVRGFLGGVNVRLPEDVAVVGAEEAAPGFHARRDARGKHYRYRILCRRTPAPLDRRFVHRSPADLDVERMAAAAARLKGRHDFSSFRNAGSVPGPGTRELRRLDISRSGDYITIDAEGDGFLYKMVRNLAGTLVLVGEGRLAPEEVGRILACRDRRCAGPAAPARGLCLVEVFY